MVQWKGLTSVCCGEHPRTPGPIKPPLCTATPTLFAFFLSGIVNMSFPLSDQPVFGEWFIFVEVQGHSYNKSFEVQKYGEALH